jgi:hypothetical protein
MEATFLCLQFARRRLKPDLMRTRALLVVPLIGCMTLIWSCVSLRSNCTAFIKDEHGIVILATPFTEADQKAMNAILAKYDTSLYKIITRENGQSTNRQGTLQDTFTDKVLAATIMQKLNEPGFTRSAIRVGRYEVSAEEAAANFPHATPTPKGIRHNPHRGASPCSRPYGIGPNPHRVQQKQLICELTPILEKYSK